MRSGSFLLPKNVLHICRKCRTLALDMSRGCGCVTRLVIFDMDGVICDSEPYHDRVRAILLKKFNISEDLGETGGKSHVEIWDPLIKRYHLPMTQPEIERWQHEVVLDMIREEGLPLSDGLLRVLQELHRRNIAVAMASSSSRWLVEHLLEYYRIRSYFCAISTGDDAKKRKPDPEIYTKVLTKCGVRPEEALALEDSDSGQEAAVAAGVPCVGYRNPTSGIHRLDRGIAVIRHMEEFLQYLQN